MKKRYLGVGAGFAAAAMILSACTPPGSDGDGDGGGGEGGDSLLNIGWNEPFRSMNTMTANGNAVANSIVTYMMNENFGYYDDNLEVQEGALGTVEQVSEDPLKVKYMFADDATWSDGAPVDAADIVLQWAAQSSNFNTAEEEEVDRDEDTGAIEEIDDDSTVFFDSASIGPSLIEDFPEISEDGKEVTFEYSQAFADWRYSLGFGADGVGVPAHIVAKKALGEEDPAAAKQAILDAIEDEDTAALSTIANEWNTAFDFTSMTDDEDLIVHNGPYKMVDFAEGQYLTLEADENYTGSKEVGVNQITIRYNEDPMAAVQAVENGEVDMIQPQATADVKSAAEAIDGVTVDSEDGATYEHVDLTYDNDGPFDPATYGGDEEKAKLVRQAFLKTLPREQIVDTIIKPLNDAATVRDSLYMVPGAPGYDEIIANNGSDEFAGGDIDGAKALLEEAGVEAPKVRVLYGASNERRAQQFTLIKESAEQAGFEVIEDGDDNWGTRLGDGTYDASLFGWQSTTTGISNSDANWRTGQQNNYGGYTSDEVDGLLDELMVTTEEADQIPLVTEIESILIEDGFGMPIFQHPELTIYRDRVQNVSTTTVSPTMFWNYWEWQVS